MRKLLSILFLFALILCFGCKVNRISTAPPVNFRELWRADTCGTKGYRAFVVKYLDENKYHVLEGKSLKYIEYHFGKPDSEVFSEEWNSIHYSYSCNAIEIKEDGRCGVLNDLSYTINIDAKTKKVIDALMRIND